MIKVTNTGKEPADIHGTLCRPDASVLVTERQWRVFKASATGMRLMGAGLITSEPHAENAPSKAKAKAPAKQDKPVEPVAVENGKSDD